MHTPPLLLTQVSTGSAGGTRNWQLDDSAKLWTFSYPTRPPPTPVVTNTTGVGGGRAPCSQRQVLRRKRGPRTTPGEQGAVVPRVNKTGRGGRDLYPHPHS